MSTSSRHVLGTEYRQTEFLCAISNIHNHKTHVKNFIKKCVEHYQKYSKKRKGLKWKYIARWKIGCYKLAISYLISSLV